MIQSERTSMRNGLKLEASYEHSRILSPWELGHRVARGIVLDRAERVRAFARECRDRHCGARLRHQRGQLLALRLLGTAGVLRAGLCRAGVLPCTGVLRAAPGLLLRLRLLRAALPQLQGRLLPRSRLAPPSRGLLPPATPLMCICVMGTGLRTPYARCAKTECA